VAQDYDHIITIEDGALNGGFGSAVLEWLADHGYAKRVTRLGIPDRFIEHGKPAELYHMAGLDTESIIKAIRPSNNNNRPSPNPSTREGSSYN
jgi:1-deoxy-D-xylulose-5-phosphate synthase